MKNINIIISIFVLVIILGGFYVISKKTIDYFNNTRYSYELTKLDSTKMVLDSNYYFDKSKNLIYWQHNSLGSSRQYLTPELDLDTFQIISQNSAKDKKFVWENAHIIGSDFKQIESSNYFKDKDSVYLKTEKIKNIDINSVKVLGSADSYNIIKDKNQIFINNSLVIPEDIESFAYLGNGWAKDENHVYYIKQKGRDSFLEKINLDPINFLPLGFYGKDKHKAVFTNSIGNMKTIYFLPKDINTFHNINGTYYAMDNISVYCEGKELIGADPKTFLILERFVNNKKIDWPLYYAKDRNHVYYSLHGIELIGADPKTFELDGTYYYSAKDSKYRYSLDGKKIAIN